MANSNITNAGRLAGLDAYSGLGSGLSSPSSAVLAKVEKAMSSQKGAVAKLNQNISSDQSKLSGLGQLQSMLADFQAVAQRVAGAGLSAAAAGLAPDANATAARDSTQVASNVKSFADAYNTLQDKLDVLGKGALKSDPALAQASRDLAGLLRTGSVSQSTLAKAGLALNGNGRLQVDDKQLNSAIAADPDAVTKLFANGGKGLAEQFNAKVSALSGQGGAIGRETQQVNKELTALNSKKANMAQALTAQANALAKLYSAQEQAASGTSASGSGGSLFDFIA